MNDFWERLRLQNLFGQPPMIGNDLPSQGGIMGNNVGQVNLPNIPFDQPSPISMPNGPTGGGPMGIEGMMNKLYTPETGANDRFNSLIDEMPRMQDFQPNMAGRIGGGLMSLASSMGPRGSINFNPEGIDAGMSFMNRPFNEKMVDWKNQVQPAQQAASLERQNNMNERQMAFNTVSSQLREEANNARAIGDLRRYELAEAKLAKIMDEAQKMGLQHTQKLEEITKSAQLAGQNQMNLQQSKGWEIAVIDDPDNPGKKITVRMNKDTGTAEPFKLGGKNLGEVTKPGTPGKNVQPANIAQIQQKTQETIQALDELIDADDTSGKEEHKIKKNILMAVGPSRYMGAQHVYGTEARAADKKIKRVKDMLTLELIGEMKAQSRTGATGFGALNMRELGVLESAASKLDPTMSEKEFLEEIKRIRNRLKMILRPDTGLDETSVPKNPTPSAADLIKRYSGQ